MQHVRPRSDHIFEAVRTHAEDGAPPRINTVWRCDGGGQLVSVRDASGGEITVVTTDADCSDQPSQESVAFLLGCGSQPDGEIRLPDGWLGLHESAVVRLQAWTQPSSDGDSPAQRVIIAAERPGVLTFWACAAKDAHYNLLCSFNVLEHVHRPSAALADACYVPECGALLLALHSVHAMADAAGSPGTLLEMWLLPCTVALPETSQDHSSDGEESAAAPPATVELEDPVLLRQTPSPVRDDDIFIPSGPASAWIVLPGSIAHFAAVASTSADDDARSLVTQGAQRGHFGSISLTTLAAPGASVPATATPAPAPLLLGVTAHPSSGDLFMVLHNGTQTDLWCIAAQEDHPRDSVAASSSSLSARHVAHLPSLHRLLSAPTDVSARSPAPANDNTPRSLTEAPSWAVQLAAGQALLHVLAQRRHVAAEHPPVQVLFAYDLATGLLLGALQLPSLVDKTSSNARNNAYRLCGVPSVPVGEADGRSGSPPVECVLYHHFDAFSVLRPSPTTHAAALASRLIDAPLPRNVPAADRPRILALRRLMAAAFTAQLRQLADGGMASPSHQLVRDAVAWAFDRQLGAMSCSAMHSALLATDSEGSWGSALTPASSFAAALRDAEDVWAAVRGQIPLLSLLVPGAATSGADATPHYPHAHEDVLRVLVTLLRRLAVTAATVAGAMGSVGGGNGAGASPALHHPVRSTRTRAGTGDAGAATPVPIVVADGAAAAGGDPSLAPWLADVLDPAALQRFIEGTSSADVGDRFAAPSVKPSTGRRGSGETLSHAFGYTDGSTHHYRGVAGSNTGSSRLDLRELSDHALPTHQRQRSGSSGVAAASLRPPLGSTRSRGPSMQGVVLPTRSWVSPWRATPAEQHVLESDAETAFFDHWHAGEELISPAVEAVSPLSVQLVPLLLRYLSCCCRLVALLQSPGSAAANILGAGSINSTQAGPLAGDDTVTTVRQPLSPLEAVCRATMLSSPATAAETTADTDTEGGKGSHDAPERQAAVIILSQLLTRLEEDRQRQGMSTDTDVHPALFAAVSEPPPHPRNTVASVCRAAVWCHS